MKKRLFGAIIATVLLGTMLIGCTSGKTKDEDTSNQTVTVTDVKGKVEIPKDPKRIVDLSGNSDILSIIGYKVVGTANSDAYDQKKLPSYLESTLKGATIVGYSMNPTMDVEAIMNLNPDLIIISTVQEKMYDELSKIAPTVMVKLDALNWKEDVKTFAKVFNKEDAADKWLKDYEAKAKSAGDKIKEKYGDNTSYLAFLASGGSFYVFDGAGFGSVLYEDMGLSKPAGMPKQSNISLPVVNYEGLSAIKADYIFEIATPADKKDLEANAIWKNLPAVKAGHIVSLPASPYFNQGYSPIGRLLLVEEMSDLLNEAK